MSYRGSPAVSKSSSVQLNSCPSTSITPSVYAPLPGRHFSRGNICISTAAASSTSAMFTASVSPEGSYLQAQRRHIKTRLRSTTRKSACVHVTRTLRGRDPYRRQRRYPRARAGCAHWQRRHRRCPRERAARAAQSRLSGRRPDSAAPAPRCHHGHPPACQECSAPHSAAAGAGRSGSAATSPPTART
eukprot:scaffold2090_cov225-Prasinococcus_capsulatus_cf.AAC.9